MEDKANIIEAFSELAPRYEQVVNTELNRFWGWTYNAFVNLLIASTSIQPQDIILDVATGTGVIPALLEKVGHPHNQIHGLDITLSMLKHAKLRLGDQNGQVNRNLVCASAMEMPYAASSFSQVICGLATHHMDVKKLICESFRLLRKAGKLTIADVGGSNTLKIPAVKFIVRIFAFCYFILHENKTRAWAESSAVSNVLSKDDWNLVLMDCGFRNIEIQELKSRYFWVPAPLLIKAEKIGDKQYG
jgi:ubiquinone/menaquinone biosynthesis C-methylase UbiE